MMADLFETITVERRGPVAWVTLNRPEALNAITLRMVEELHALFDSLYQDRSIFAVVLRGAGRAFCAGLDLKEAASGAHRDNAPFAGGFDLQSHMSDLYVKMRRCPQPIVALVHGAACGGGLAFAVASDIRIAGHSARMSVMTIKLGLSGCEMGMSYLLPRMVGVSVASEMMLTGRFVDAERALRTGLVSEVVPDDQLEATAQTYLDDMLLGTPLGLRLTKDGINHALAASGLEAAIAVENRNQLMAGRTEDSREARLAALEKRRPEFRNT